MDLWLHCWVVLLDWLVSIYGQSITGHILAEGLTSMQAKLTGLKVMGNPASRCQFPFSILKDVAQQSLIRWISVKLGSETGLRIEPARDSGWLEGGGGGGGGPENAGVSDGGAHLMNWKCFFRLLTSDLKSREPVEKKAS